MPKHVEHEVHSTCCTYKEQVRFRDIVINHMFKALKWRLSSWIQVRNAVLPPVVLKKRHFISEKPNIWKAKHHREEGGRCRGGWGAVERREGGGQGRGSEGEKLCEQCRQSCRERWWGNKPKGGGEEWSEQCLPVTFAGKTVLSNTNFNIMGRGATKLAHRKHIYCAPQGGEAIGTVHSYPHTFRKSGVYL